MIKYLISILLTIMFFSCKHPESDIYNRNQKVKTNQEEFENNNLVNSKIPLSYDEKDEYEITEDLKYYNRNIVEITIKGGVYEIPVEINGSKMNFIFDTGASDITISEVEAIFLLKQGTLSENDILGVQEYQIADGSISEGTIINLKTVKIGNKTLYNVKASVIHNMQAPLLLGQSALAQFGKVSIDYKRKEIIFE